MLPNHSLTPDFTVAEVTPIMFDNIGYKTYIVFMCFCVVGFFYAWILLPELKGESSFPVPSVACIADPQD